MRVERSGGVWNAFLEARGALLEACGALWKLVERPRGSWSALLEAQACGALRWKFLERSEGSWSPLEAMVMEARLRAPPCRVAKVVPNRHFVIYNYVLNSFELCRPLAGQ